MSPSPAVGTPIESLLRDGLAKRLDLIGENLTLVEVEYHLRNPDGAGGFIDILARDGRGDLVVIELKRADQSARQALHELEKYVGLLAKQVGIRTDQLRCVLVSTTWHELAEPFSRYKQHVDFFLTGLRLFLDEHGALDRCEKFELLPASTGSEVCPMYMGMLYADSNRRSNAVDQVRHELSEMKISDYILVQVEYDGSQKNVMYPFGVFLIFASFSPAVELQVMKLFPDEFEDDDVYEEDDYWHEQVIQSMIAAKVPADEIANESPRHWGSLTDWKKTKAAGFGVYQDTVVWTEEALLKIVAGSSTPFATNYLDQVSPEHEPAWARMRASVKALVSGAGIWSDVIEAWLLEAESRKSETRIAIYYPADILSGLEAIARNNDVSFIAGMMLGRKSGFSGQSLIGQIVWDGTSHDVAIDSMLGDLDCDLIDYLSGGSWILDAPILRALGLRYAAFETSFGPDGVVDGSRQELVFVGGAIERTPVDPKRSASIADFFLAHTEFKKSLLDSFDSSVLRI